MITADTHYPSEFRRPFCGVPFRSWELVLTFTGFYGWQAWGWDLALEYNL